MPCWQRCKSRLINSHWTYRDWPSDGIYHFGNFEGCFVDVPVFHIDAFTGGQFAGNPAALLLLERYPLDSILQAIAEEHNLSETAFLIPDKGDYHIRWFTPTTEVPLCGHATLASAAAVLENIQPGRRAVVFQSASGPLSVGRSRHGYVMDFPARVSTTVAVPDGLAEALGVAPVEVLADRFNYLVLLQDARSVRSLAPDIAGILRLDRSGVIVTAAGDQNFDIVSRYFAPAKGIPEDPVTGGAHCALTPYWAGRLGKSELRAFQASRRGGELHCRLNGDRVELEGQCAIYLVGRAKIDMSSL
jgi:PhzF family phenazine biosynthesis protein